MAIDSVASATRRRNVKPVSSIIRANLTRDIDVSAMASPPEDGEFVIVRGKTGEFKGGGVLYFGVNAGAVTALNIDGSMLRIVWGSAQRSDRQALGESRVPVIWMGPIEIETNLYMHDKDANLDGPLNYPVGTLVTVTPLEAVAAAGTLQDSDERLIMTPLPSGQSGWVVGQVTGSDTGVGASGKKVRVLLFDMPRFHNDG